MLGGLRGQRDRADTRRLSARTTAWSKIAGSHLWIVSKEDLILSKLDWARQTQSERQLSDVENLLATGANRIPKHMVSKIEPDRYADTGFSVADTPEELNAFLFQEIMAKTGAERLIIGCGMADSARKLVWSGIPRNLPEEERRTRFVQRFYGEGITLSIL